MVKVEPKKDWLEKASEPSYLEGRDYMQVAVLVIGLLATIGGLAYGVIWLLGR